VHTIQSTQKISEFLQPFNSQIRQSVQFGNTFAKTQRKTGKNVNQSRLPRSGKQKRKKKGKKGGNKKIKTTFFSFLRFGIPVETFHQQSFGFSCSSRVFLLLLINPQHHIIIVAKKKRRRKKIPTKGRRGQNSFFTNFKNFGILLFFILPVFFLIFFGTFNLFYKICHKHFALRALAKPYGAFVPARRETPVPNGLTLKSAPLK